MNYGLINSKLDGTESTYNVKKTIPIPASYSYVKYLSPILDQGSTSTCVPHALSAHLNWNYNVDNKTSNKLDNGVSINDIYKIRKDKSQDGMQIKEALSYLKNTGVKSKKGIMKIKYYARVPSELALKYALIANGPCVGALKVWNDSFEFWNKQAGDTFLGGHAIAIVGYNKDGFIIRNSWGKSWANYGYSTLKYSDFSKFLELWTIID